MDDFLIRVALPLVLVFIMLTLGLGLRISDFTRVFAIPKAFSIGILNQMLVLPFVGFLIAIGFDLAPELAVGMIILALCPGGVTSIIFSRIAGGHLALSISLTAVVTLVSVITVPFFAAISVRFFIGSEAPEVDTLSLSLSMVVLTIVPVSIGMFLTSIAPNWTARAAPPMGRIAVGLFILVVTAAIAANWDVLMANYAVLGPAVVGLNLVLLAIGVTSSRVLGLDGRDSTTIAIESGIQNGTLGIAVAALIADQIYSQTSGLSNLALPSAVYGATMYLVSLPFVLWRRRQH